MTLQSLKLPSCVSSICHLETFVDNVTRKYRVEKDKFPDILISLTEAVNNAIVHGNKSDTRKFVDIHLQRTHEGLAFLVSDEGNGFNPFNLPDPTAPENIHCCGGRGVFLMKQLADDVRFYNNGSTVEICFYL